jgi:hypothetical protein
MFKLSTNKCYNELFKSIKHILNVMLKYKPKRNVGLLRHSKMTHLHLECQNSIKNIKFFFLAPTFLIFLSQPVECKFLIKKN